MHNRTNTMASDTLSLPSQQPRLSITTIMDKEGDSTTTVLSPSPIVENEVEKKKKKKKKQGQPELLSPLSAASPLGGGSELTTNPFRRRMATTKTTIQDTGVGPGGSSNSNSVIDQALSGVSDDFQPAKRIDKGKGVSIEHTLQQSQQPTSASASVLVPTSTSARGSLFSVTDVDSSSTVTRGEYGEYGDYGDENDGVDWESFEPPEALTRLPNVESDIIKYVVEESITRIKVRIEEKKDRAREREEAERRAREMREDQQGKEVVIDTSGDGGERRPSITVAEYGATATPVDGTPRLGVAKQDTNLATTSTLDSRKSKDSSISRPDIPTKSSKRSRFGLRRLLGREEKAESMAMGVSRHKGSRSVNRIDLSLAAMLPHAIPRARPADLLSALRLSSDSGGPTKAEELVECVSCLDDVPVSATVNLSSCSHSYCRPCFVRLVASSTSNETHWPPKCCLSPIPKTQILPNIPEHLRKTFGDKEAEWSIPAADRIYCSVSTCSLFIPSTSPNPNPNSNSNSNPAAAAAAAAASSVDHATRTARCAGGHRTCTLCRGAAHPGTETCPNDVELLRTEALATEEGWKRCTSCGVLVEHRDACQHMTCRCGAQFCYVCGLVWRTCSCSMEELGRLKRRAAERRDGREREEREAAEAVRQVEEFEREEERKRALLELERARREREERRAGRRKRRSEEGERKRVVGEKFVELGAMMRELDELQRVVLGYEQDRRREGFLEGVQMVRRDVREEVERKKEEARRIKEEKVGDVKLALDMQSKARLAEQTAQEMEYEAVLRAFWEGKCRKEEHVAPRVEGSLNPWKAQNRERMALWIAWREEEMQRKKDVAEEEEGIQVEIAEAAVERTEENVARRENEEMARRKAEWRWFRAVIGERGDIMEDMEKEELGAMVVEEDTEDEGDKDGDDGELETLERDVEEAEAAAGKAADGDTVASGSGSAPGSAIGVSLGNSSSSSSSSSTRPGPTRPRRLYAATNPMSDPDVHSTSSGVHGYTLEVEVAEERGGGGGEPGPSSGSSQRQGAGQKRSSVFAGFMKKTRSGDSGIGVAI
ncbi:E3 ubiquitin-protein ligase rbrA like [Zalerion maritima]|uniref:RBR-type E3 ubiquitin transferase n=1 Tax=Zalerion maritima TaxID=339359 RepID=A0AAD5RMN2_9PEZI|nr:E3 ubiquitin-protein ligase rbrA like [Zalerion maritima]